MGGQSLKNNEEKFIENWGRDRRKGKNSYILNRSLILGMTMGVASAILKFVRGDIVHIDFFYFIGGYLGGIIGTRYSWHKNEEGYNELMNKRL